MLLLIDQDVSLGTDSLLLRRVVPYQTLQNGTNTFSRLVPTMTSILAELERYQRVDALVAQYMALPRWTAAQGAMLLCGIAPLGDCASIAEPAVLLENEMEFASELQIRSAHHVLSEWIEDFRDEQGVRPSPRDAFWSDLFVSWADDRFNQVGKLRPLWLDQFVQRSKERTSTERFSAAMPIALVRRALELEERALRTGKRYGPSPRGGRPSKIADWLSWAWNSLGEGHERTADTILAKLEVTLSVQTCEPMFLIDSDGITYIEYDGQGRCTERPYPRDNVRRWVSREYKKVGR